jgi:hypothetical protein
MYEDQPSPYMPELPGLPELPEIIDAKTKGLRLQGTLAKALPGMKDVGYSSNIRQVEAEEYARDIAAAFEISRAYDKRSRALARAKNRQMERYAKEFGVR